MRTAGCPVASMTMVAGRKTGLRGLGRTASRRGSRHHPGFGSSPSAARIQARTKIWVQAKADTGFPGNPIAMVVASGDLQSENGRPGCMRTPRISVDQPRAIQCAGTRSSTPALTPPTVMTKSAVAAAASSAAAVAWTSSAACVGGDRTAPKVVRSVKSEARSEPFELRIRTASSGPLSRSSIGRTSSPVVTMATRGRGRTLTNPVPMAAPAATAIPRAM